ncbi:MAG: WD40 repeat domain-containing protein [Pseudonocardiaceae bacterium]
MSSADQLAVETARAQGGERCPVCELPINSALACSRCQWPLRGDYRLGELTEEIVRLFEEQLQTAQRRFDLAAAVRVARAGDRLQLAELEALIRGGTPDPAERDAALRDAPVAGVPSTPSAHGVRTARDLLSRLPSESGAVIIRVDDEGVLASIFERAPGGELRERAELGAWPWPTVLPALSTNPVERRFQLAGGIGRHPVDPAAVEESLRSWLTAMDDLPPRVGVFSTLPGWVVPSQVVDELQRRCSAEVLAPDPAGAPRPAVIRCPAEITAVSIADAPLRGHCATVACGGIDGSLRVWSVPSGESLADPVFEPGRITAIEVSDQGVLVSGGWDGGVRVRRIGEDAQPRLLHGHSGRVNAVQLRGDVVFSIGDDGRVRRSTLRGTAEDTPGAFPLRVGLSGNALLAVTADGGLLVTGGGDAVVRVWHGATAERLAEISTDATVSALAFDPAQRRLAIGGADGTVRIYDIATQRQRDDLTGHAGPVRAIALRRGMALTGDESGCIRRWRTTSERTLGPAEVIGTHGGPIRGLATLTEELVISAGHGRLIRVWSLPPVGSHSRIKEPK